MMPLVGLPAERLASLDFLRLPAVVIAASEGADFLLRGGPGGNWAGQSGGGS